MTEVQHANRAHARLSPSGAARWMRCPRSYHWEPEFPDQETSYAAEGTAVHELSEAALTDYKVARDYVGKWFNGYRITEEMADTAQVYCDAINETPGERHLEVRLHHPHIEEMFGTADGIHVEDGYLTVTDLKAGRGVKVDAPNNPQLRIYGLMAYYHFDWLFDVQGVTTRIVQPRLDHDSSEELTADELLAWERDELIPAINALDETPDKMVAGEHCRFCKAAGVCPELARVNMAAAEAIFEDAPALPTDITEPDFPTPDSLTKEQVAAVLGHRKQIEAWLKAVETHAQAAIEAGEEVPGYKLVAGRTQRKWDDEDAALEVARSAGDDEDILTEPRLKSPAQLEKAIGKARFRELMEPFVARADGKPTLAPESDKRPALELQSPEEMFAE